MGSFEEQLASAKPHWEDLISRMSSRIDKDENHEDCGHGYDIAVMQLLPIFKDAGAKFIVLEQESHCSLMDCGHWQEILVFLDKP